MMKFGGICAGLLVSLAGGVLYAQPAAEQGRGENSSAEEAAGDLSELGAEGSSGKATDSIAAGQINTHVSNRPEKAEAEGLEAANPEPLSANSEPSAARHTKESEAQAEQGNSEDKPGEASTAAALKSLTDKAEIRFNSLLTVRSYADNSSGLMRYRETFPEKGRFFMRGKVGKVQTLLHYEFAGEPRLLDLEMVVELKDAWQLRIGQFRTPFSRQLLTPIGALALAQRSLASAHFHAGRDRGLSVEYMPETGARFQLGAYNGSGTGDRQGKEGMILGRAELGSRVLDESPANTGWGVGTSFYVRNRTDDDDESAGRAEVAVELDGTYSTGRWQLTGELFFRYYDRYFSDTSSQEQEYGANVQGAVFVYRDIIDLAAGISTTTEAGHTAELASNIRFPEYNTRLQLSFRRLMQDGQDIFGSDEDYGHRLLAALFVAL